MDTQTYVWAVILLGLILAGIGGIAWLIKRTGLVPGVVGLRRNGRRLRVVEVTAVDVKRKLVLVRRDDTEHLILLGMQSDLVVESGIRVDADPMAEIPVATAGTGS